MVVTAFPPLDTADSHGLLAIGGDLELETLILAYNSGIFPWPLEDVPLAWFSPPKRAVLYLKDFHIPASLRRSARKNKHQIKFNTCFSDIINNCAAVTNRTGQNGTWITPAMIKAYCRLHEAGYAHSVECFMDGELAGGMYGVSIGQMFAGESMFYHRPDASKLCLWALVEALLRNEVQWMDCQVMTPHMKRFGAKQISRRAYIELLEKSKHGMRIKL